LSEAEGEVGYYDLAEKIGKLSGRTINYHQFGGILSGVTRTEKKLEKEMLIDVDADGWVFYLNQKYRKAIRDYFMRRKD